MNGDSNDSLPVPMALDDVNNAFAHLNRLEQRLKASDARNTLLEQAIAGVEIEKNTLKTELVEQKKAFDDTIRQMNEHIQKLQNDAEHFKTGAKMLHEKLMEVSKEKSAAEEGLNQLREQLDTIHAELDNDIAEKERMQERIRECEVEAREMEAALQKKHKRSICCFA